VEGVDLEGRVQCRDKDQIAGGVGNVRIEAPTDGEADTLLTEVRTALVDAFPAATLNVRDRGRGRPSAVVTAPLWAAVLGGVAGSLLPVSAAVGDTGGPLAPAPAPPGRRRSPLRTSRQPG
jgi:hypothetical protein